MRGTVLIVDDHEVYRRAARALLEADGYAVVGEADGGEAALAAVQALRPDVVVLDIRLPDIDGLAVADRIVAGPDPPAVVLISSRPAATYGPSLARSGARGFIAKSDLSGAALAGLLG